MAFQKWYKIVYPCGDFVASRGLRNACKRDTKCLGSILRRDEQITGTTRNDSHRIIDRSKSAWSCNTIGCYREPQITHMDKARKHPASPTKRTENNEHAECVFAIPSPSAFGDTLPQA